MYCTAPPNGGCLRLRRLQPLRPLLWRSSRASVSSLRLKLSSEALDVADDVSTRQRKQWARSLQWWAGEGIEEPEIPGPLLRPYFQMLGADDKRVDDSRAIAVLTAALETSNATGERFCEAEILRLRADRRAQTGAQSALEDYRAALGLARQQGAKMLELRALTSWARHPSTRTFEKSSRPALMTSHPAGRAEAWTRRERLSGNERQTGATNSPPRLQPVSEDRLPRRSRRRWNLDAAARCQQWPTGP